jgi:hypothetical protein
MLLKQFDNLIVTGRCIDTSHESMASARVSPTAMALGEAAGTAAALAISTGIESFSKVDVKKLREILVNNKCIVAKEE